MKTLKFETQFVLAATAHGKDFGSMGSEGIYQVNSSEKNFEKI